MVAADRRPSTFLTEASFHNAIVALAAIGGSTNAVVHLLAIAGRLGIDLTLDDFDRIGSQVPVLVDLQPAGRFLMEDFHRAGGLLAVLREVRDLLDPTALTVTGRPLVDYLDERPIWDPEVIRPRPRRWWPRAASPSCAATSPPTARSSSRRPPRRTCCGTAAGPWSSTASRTSTPASTTPTSTSTPTPCWCCAAAGPRATPACRRWRTCRCRRSCSSRASATWSGSATAG